MGPDPDLDEALVAAARDALGPDVNLMVDAGRAWNAETALERVARFEKIQCVLARGTVAPV